jgi:hypothetical protein
MGEPRASRWTGCRGVPTHVLADLLAVPADRGRLGGAAVPTDGRASLAYRDDGTGPAVLCLAGAARETAADFEPVVEAFSARARVVRLDLRGRGGSQHDPNYLNYNILTETRDALELMDHLEIDGRSCSEPLGAG